MKDDIPNSAIRAAKQALAVRTHVAKPATSDKTGKKKKRRTGPHNTRYVK